MSRQVVFGARARLGAMIFASVLLCGVSRAATAPALAEIPSDDKTERCFDFSPKGAKVDHLVKKDAADSKTPQSGKIKNDTWWALVRGNVDKPVGQVLALLLDHNTTKSKRVDEMEVTQVTDPRYLALHEVKFEVKPFPLVTVEWVEQWAYTLLKGTAAAPEELLVTYQKASGTKHIEHLCGQMLLKRKSPTATELTIYEEARATGRSQEDTVSGLKGTLNTLEKAPLKTLNTMKTASGNS